MTLMQLWRLHKGEFRSVGGIVADARAGKLAGVEPHPSGHGFAVVDRNAAFAAMKKDNSI
jgi:hypothetical protein